MRVEPPLFQIFIIDIPDISRIYPGFNPKMSRPLSKPGYLGSIALISVNHYFNRLLMPWNQLSVDEALCLSAEIFHNS
jgi:hypothetical protein